jgi:beta-glucosidase
MWYPGVAGGVSTADVLVGNVDPSGKLPITFPDGSAARPRFPTDDPGCDPSAIVIPNNSTGTGANDGNCPLYPGVFTSNPTQGQHTYRTVDMQTNGIFQGYRWYDVHAKAPLFPFGHGLSYTRFSYSHLLVTPRVGAMTVSFDVTNSGSVQGAEVPQVYVGSPASPPVPMAVRALAGFDRVSLAPGETKHLTIEIAPRAFQYWSVADHAWTTAWGDRQIAVGSSSRDLRLSATDAPLKPAALEVLDLLAMVHGVGPGNSLNAKAQAIQAAIAAGRTDDACAQLAALEHEVSAQTGKKIPAATASALQREAGRVAGAVGC